MKRIVLLIIGVLMLTSVYAQWSNEFLIHKAEKHFLYGTGNVMLGNYNGGDVGINYIYNSKYSVNFGFSVSSKSASNQLTESLKSAKTNSIDLKVPDEHLENFHLMIGRVFDLSPKNNIRVVIQGGPGVSAIREPVFTTINNNETVFSNYQIGFRKRQQVSLILNPKIEFPITSVLGFSIGPMLIVNDERTFFGVSIGVLYGIISRESG